MDTLEPQDGRDDGESRQRGGTGINSRRVDEQLHVIHSQMRKLQNTIDTLRVKLEERGRLDNRRHTQVTNVILRIALRPWCDQELFQV